MLSVIFYPGDTSLSDDTKERIVATFGQALDLTEAGSHDEALVGCDFIVVLDPLFEPARVLRERLRGAEDTVRTEDLRNALGGDVTASPGPDATDSPASFQAAAEKVLEPDPQVAQPSMVETDAGAPPHLDDENQRRIAELLDQGQDAYDSGEYRSARDSWLRVLLIDIDHAEANRRVEQARRASEAEVEEVFHEAMWHLDTGDLDSARQSLNRVRDLQPSHLAAQQYLARIDSIATVSGSPDGSTETRR